MNSIALFVETDPSRPERIILARWNDNACVVIRRVCQSIDDFELSGWARTNRRPHRYLEGAKNFSVLDHRELALWNADDNLTPDPTPCDPPRLALPETRYRSHDYECHLQRYRSVALSASAFWCALRLIRHAHRCRRSRAATYVIDKWIVRNESPVS